VETGGVSLVLVAIFYAGAAPAALASSILPEERWTHVSVLLVMWTALWLTLAATTSATGV
jgi:hypothetical protein